MLLIVRFLEAIFPIRNTERLVRAANQDTLNSLVSPTLIGEANPEVVALLPYSNTLVRALIKEAKYHENQKAFGVLGRVLAEYVQAFVADEDAFSKREFILVPIPLSHTRLLARGYNQTERICRAALAHLGERGAPNTHTLKRTRDTHSQTRLTKEKRLTNIQNAFKAQGVMPKHCYLLIDDVVTTGATLADATRALKMAGATRVIAIALAH